MHSEFRFRNFQILDISDVIKIYKRQKNENTNFQFYRFSKWLKTILKFDPELKYDTLK